MDLKENIKNLMELQNIDLQVRRLDDDMAGGEKELASRRQKIAEKQQAIAELTDRRGACEARKREVEAEVEDEFAKIKDRQAKMMNVQTNREYQSLLKEIEDGKEANRHREDEAVLLMEEIESIDKKLSELQNACNAEEQLLAEEADKVATLTDKLVAEKKRIVKSRAAKAAKVAANYLKRYELLREKRNGLAVVGVTNGVCLGCNMNIPPQMFNNLLREEEMLSCPICNRMMYHQPEQTAEES